MRSWHPIPPICLDNKAILGEHNEIHAIHSIISQNLKGYAKHPEVLRWRGHIQALRERHHIIVQEMLARGMRHRSPLPKPKGRVSWPGTVEPVEMMRRKLGLKLQARNQIPVGKLRIFT